MTRITEDELVAALRIFNRTVDIIAQTHQGYHGRKNLGIIKNFLSSNRWIMFPIANVHSLREAVQLPVPNVFISFHDGEFMDNGDGRAQACIGLSFNNEYAMDWLYELLERRNVARFMGMLNSMDKSWRTEITQKIKLNHKDSAPIYQQQTEFPVETVSPKDIADALEESDNNLPRYHDEYDENGISGTILNAISIVAVYKYTDVSNFDRDVQQIFDLFFRVLSLR